MNFGNRIGAVSALAAAVIAVLGGRAPAAASTYTVLHNFCGNASCTDGENSQTVLLKEGNLLYGVAAGGAHGHGMVFRYNLTSGAYTDLYDMCSTTNINGHCKDGDSPYGSLIIDTGGNLYGTTQFGGLSNAGQVYELVKPTGGGAWTFKLLHMFCDQCSDGNDPITGLAYSGQNTGTDYDGASLLFGAALAGGDTSTGTLQGHGVIYALKNTSGSWSEKVIHIFCVGCSDSCTSCGDGIEPDGNLYIDADDNLWGATLIGGSDAHGTAFELTPGADEWSNPWTETILYNFCWNGATKCLDGAVPNGVVLDAGGNVWGTTGEGGSGATSTGSGTVFELTNGSCTEGGTHLFWCDTVKHNFCASGCSDGQYPPGNTNLVIDGSGILYGTAELGGAHSEGTLFKQNGSSFTKLYDFCASSGCADGSVPFSGLTLDSSGNLYGVADQGGANSKGTLYKWSP